MINRQVSFVIHEHGYLGQLEYVHVMGLFSQPPLLLRICILQRLFIKGDGSRRKTSLALSYFEY